MVGFVQIACRLVHAKALSALAALAFLGTPPAHAVGRLTDINVIDRDSGATLPVYRHRGDYWVAGRPGGRYAVSVRNASGERVLGVISVDGVNVVSGETASWEQTGYVLSPWQSFDISGWRKSDAEVAAFHFAASQASYAARTGRPDHVGVIGKASRSKSSPISSCAANDKPLIAVSTPDRVRLICRTAASGWGDKAPASITGISAFKT